MGDREGGYAVVLKGQSVYDHSVYTMGYMSSLVIVAQSTWTAGDETGAVTL